MRYPLNAAQKRFIRTEVAIGTVLGSLLPAIAMYLTMGPFPMPMWGSEGFAAFLLKNAMGMGTVMTLILTLVVRMRVRKGSAPALAWNRTEEPLLRFIPRYALVRAPAFGLCAVAIPGLLGLGVVLLVGIDTIERLPFALFMGAHSALIALLLLPFIIVGALSDSGHMQKGGQPI